jgi:hypothetical protein
VKRVAASKSKAVEVRPKIKFIEGDELANCLADLRQGITQRAYELYRMRGGEPGHDLEDWAQAETELMRPFPGNITESGGYLTLRGFVPEAEITQIGCEPQRILVWIEGSADSGQPGQIPGVLMFDLTQPVDPLRSSADRVGQILTVKLAKAQAVEEITASSLA